MFRAQRYIKRLASIADAFVGRGARIPFPIHDASSVQQVAIDGAFDAIPTIQAENTDL